MVGSDHLDERYEHYILCVMSTISAARDENNKPRPRTMAEVEEATKAYEHNDNNEGLSFDGFQTNEAPVKCLIDLGLIEKNPVTRIICLTSPACEKKNAIVTNEGECLSAKDWFERSVAEFYRDYEERSDEENPALQEGFFCHLPYDGTNPSGNLHALIQVLDECPALIDIDTTGGPRDAAFLLTSVVQFIEAKYAGAARLTSKSGKPIGLGRTVYSNYAEKKIHLQNETLAINTLIRAITAFTQYGKAEPLEDFFINRRTTATPASKEMKGLCGVLRTFANDLSLCRTASINTRVNNIHERLAAFKSATEQKMARYAVDQDPVNKVGRSEILFFTLADNLERDIPNYVADNSSGEEKADQTLAIIRWCIDRGMLQQAVALYKERIPECLEQKGLIGWGNNTPQGRNPDARNEIIVDRVTQLATFKKPGVDSFLNRLPDVLNRNDIESLSNHVFSCKAIAVQGKTKKAILKKVLCAALPSVSADAAYLEIKDTARLPAILVRYSIITSIRNRMMHVLEEDDQLLRAYLRYCRALFQNFNMNVPDRFTPGFLSRFLKEALSDISERNGVVLQLSPQVNSAYRSWRQPHNTNAQGQSHVGINAASTTNCLAPMAMASAQAQSHVGINVVAEGIITLNGIDTERFMRISPPDLSIIQPDELVRELEHSLESDIAFIISEDVAMWDTQYNALINSSPTLEMRWAVIVRNQSSFEPILKNKHYPNIEAWKEAWKEARDVILETSKLCHRTYQLGGNDVIDDYVTWDDIKDEEPFLTQRGDLEKQLQRYYSGSGKRKNPKHIFYGLSMAFPKNFEAVRCIMLRTATP